MALIKVMKNILVLITIRLKLTSVLDKLPLIGSEVNYLARSAPFALEARDEGGGCGTVLNFPGSYILGIKPSRLGSYTFDALL